MKFWHRHPYKEECLTNSFLEPRLGHNPLRTLVGEARAWAGEYYNERHVVGMFRDPRRRLWSAYNYFKHTNGMSKEARANMLENTPSVKEYAAYPGIGGCQVKMLLGRRCNENVRLTEAKLEKAKLNLRTRFQFVGLTEEWNDSVCLFYAMFGSHPNPVAFQNVRPSNQVSGEYVQERALQELSPEDDPWDYAL